MSTVEILSMLPGTFYRKSSPDQPFFAEEGQTIAVGQVIGLIEVMKQYNELPSDVAGKLVSFEVEDGDAVEAGQVIAIVEG